MTLNRLLSNPGTQVWSIPPTMNFGAALALPPGLRAMLAEHLLKSLDATEQAGIDALWVDEVEKRVQAIEQGNVTLIPGEQVLRELHSRNRWWSITFIQMPDKNSHFSHPNLRRASQSAARTSWFRMYHGFSRCNDTRVFEGVQAPWDFLPLLWRRHVRSTQCPH